MQARQTRERGTTKIRRTPIHNQHSKEKGAHDHPTKATKHIPQTGWATAKNTTKPKTHEQPKLRITMDVGGTIVPNPAAKTRSSGEEGGTRPPNQGKE